MLVDIDSTYWDLPVLREAIAARVWGAADQGGGYRLETLIDELEAVSGTATSAVPVPASGTAGGRHRRATPVG